MSVFLLLGKENIFCYSLRFFWLVQEFNWHETDKQEKIQFKYVQKGPSKKNETQGQISNWAGSWWWTGRPGVLRFMGLQRVRHNWATELNWGLQGYEKIKEYFFNQNCVFKSFMNLKIGFPCSYFPKSDSKIENHLQGSCFISYAWLVTQSWPTLCDSMDSSSMDRLFCPWNFPARILEWIAISYSKGSSQPRDQTRVF